MSVPPPKKIPLPKKIPPPQKGGSVEKFAVSGDLPNPGPMTMASAHSIISSPAAKSSRLKFSHVPG